MISRDSLVVYKGQPARVLSINDKFEIELHGCKILKVRLKDILPLHPGPVASLDQLTPQIGDIEDAWELVIGETVTLAGLAELVYGNYTPATAWAAWQLVSDELYFKGTPEAITARSSEEVCSEQKSRLAKTAREHAWWDFINRVAAGRFISDDTPFLKEVEALALGRAAKSHVLQELGRNQTPENAHALLLELGYWDYAANPYPGRLQLATGPATAVQYVLPEEQRLDLTHLTALAIDDEESKDPEDALSFDGSNRLWVHVADAAALVPADSTADLEARARGATLYLPEMVVPMLPPDIAHKLAFKHNEVSPALSFGLELAGNGKVDHIEIVPSRVRVTRMSYKEAESRLDEPPLQMIHTITTEFENRRLSNGAVAIDLPEVKIRVLNGQVLICPIQALRSNNLVREAMLMAGEAIARLALEKGIALPFATQAKGEDKEFPEGLAGMFARRRSMTRSQLRSVPAPHNGLGLELYTQATSPLRRYLDLVAHQQLRAFVSRESFMGAQAILERVGAAEAIVDSVRQAERFSCRHWTLVYLLQHPDWCGNCVLVDKRQLRGTILIPELGLVTQLYLHEDLPLNSELPVMLSGVNLPQLEAYFRIGN